MSWTMKKYLFYISQNYSFAILRPIQKILQQRGDQVRWFFEGDAVNPAYLMPEETRLDSIDLIKTYHPDAVLAPANSIPSFIPGLKVAVFHGFDAGKLDRQGRNDHFKIRGCFDLYCTQGPDTTREFNTLKKKYGYFNVIQTGWSALDPLFEQPESPLPHEKPVVLLCSTFTHKLSCAKQLLPVVAELSRSGKWQWLIQFHPKMEAAVIAQYQSIQSKHLHYIETDNVIPLLQQADVMVCDTSSVILMFLIQNKPVVTFKNIDPGPYLLDIDNPALLEQSITRALSHPPELMQQLQQKTAQTHPYQDGKSAQRVVTAIDEVLAGKHPLKKSRPLNFFRNLKFRQRLHYWNFL